MNSFSEAAAAPANMHLFLLIGQSNMAGRGRVEAADRLSHPHIWMYDRDMRWVPAKDPVHFDKPELAGVGLCSEFARTVLGRQAGHDIGLIPAAMGGSSLDEWRREGHLYKNAVSRTHAAMKSGALAGILWHQGEADRHASLAETYADRFATFVAQLRRDLDAAQVPLVVGEIGRFVPGCEAINRVLHGLPELVPPCRCVSSEGLVDGGDSLHFDAASCRVLGQRYAEAYLKMAAVG